MDQDKVVNYPKIITEVRESIIKNLLEGVFPTLEEYRHARGMLEAIDILIERVNTAVKKHNG